MDHDHHRQTANTVQLRYTRTTHTRIIRAYFAYMRMLIRAHIRIYIRAHMRIYTHIYVSLLCTVAIKESAGK